MNPDREKSCLEKALRMPPSERAAWLDRECGDDPGLRDRLLGLLAGGEAAGTVPVERKGPNASTIRLEFPDDREDEAVGRMLGRYKLLERIGEGGCGVVYVAEQVEPVRRRVAVKVIKLGMDTRSVVARFEAERQALAMMDHPNIAKVLDAGATGSGRPYFVMELVRGIPITQFCDQSNRNTRERLDLFIQVCQAIQHAHQKGIIHRDIKPTNVLVTLHDGVAVPKVIDFGIAKATEGRLTDNTVYTQLNQFIGTPAYMSPEQAEMSGLDIDTRSDLYSLGVLLYELLAGSTPFHPEELASGGFDAMRRMIREKEPVRPSTRLATLGQDLLTTAARRRSMEAPKLLRQVRGDLDWIVMKCLEKDRARRYDSATALAQDVQRHIANEPVLARPPSRLYRFRKLVRRNQTASLALVSVFLALSIGLGALIWQQSQAASAAAVTDFTQRLLTDTLPGLIRQGNTRGARELVNTTDRLVALSLSNAPVAELSVRFQLWRILIEQMHDFPAALRQAEALDRLAPRFGLVPDFLKRDAPRVLVAATRLWDAGSDVSRQEQAVREIGALRAEIQARGGFLKEMWSRECLSAEGTWLIAAGRLERAEAVLTEGLRTLEPDPKTGRRPHRLIAEYAHVLTSLGRPAEAEAIIRTNLDLQLGPDLDSRILHWGLVAELCSALCAQGQFAEATQWVSERTRWLSQNGDSLTERIFLASLEASIPARAGAPRRALRAVAALATNEVAGVAEWHAAAVLSCSLGEIELHRQLCRMGLIRFASIAEDEGAELLARALLLQPDEEMSRKAAEVMLARVAASPTWSRYQEGWLRAEVASKEQRFREALEHLDRYRSNCDSGQVFPVGVNQSAGHRADLAFFHAQLVAELGRPDEARQDFAQGLGLLASALGKVPGQDRGENWLATYEAGIRRRTAESVLRAKGIPLPNAP
jgi:serine/threonine protein kinase